MITDKQKANIHKLSFEDCQVILHEIAERWGVVSVEQYNEVTLVPKRTIYDGIEHNRIRTFEFVKKFPCVNKA